MSDRTDTATDVRHPRYVHANFQCYLSQLGVRAPQRKAYACWLTRFIVFHHGKPLESLGQHHVRHFLEFLLMYENVSEHQQHEAHCCLRLFYQCFLPQWQSEQSQPGENAGLSESKHRHAETARHVGAG